MNKKIETLSSIEGRKFLYTIFKKLKYENEISGLTILVICWKLCVYEKNPSKFTETDYTILHSLGFVKGTALWMEEIVNRHYFSTINSFVYLGAAILLVIIGIRRFTESMPTSLVIASIVFEASMLLVIFIVMLFSPNEELTDDEESEESILIQEIGEISTDFAIAVSKLENITNELKTFSANQVEVMKLLNSSNENLIKAISPSDEFLINLKKTNEELNQFKEQITILNESTKTIKEMNIRFEIRREIEEMLISKVNKNDKK
jgi:hypothetical protein